MADEAAVADGAEGRAVGEEGVEPDLPQRAEHLLDRVEQRLDLRGVARVEGLDELEGLVEAQRAAGGVDHLDPVRTLPELHRAREQHGVAAGVAQRHLGDAVEERAQRLRPGEGDAVVALLTVAQQPEGPDAAAVEGDVDELVAGAGDQQARGVDPEDLQRGGTPQLAQGPHAADYTERQAPGFSAYWPSPSVSVSASGWTSVSPSSPVSVAVVCTMLWSEAWPVPVTE